MIAFVRRAFLPALIVAAVVALLAVFVFPTRTWLDQRAEAQAIADDTFRVKAENARLEGRIALLNTDEEIERIARTEFSFVYPGEEAYAVLPEPEQPVALPLAWPFVVLQDSLSD